MPQYANNNLNRDIIARYEEMLAHRKPSNKLADKELQLAIDLSEALETALNKRREEKKENLKKNLIKILPNIDKEEVIQILPNIDKEEVIQTTNGNGSCLLYAIEQSLPSQYDYPLSEDHPSYNLPSYNLDYLMKGGRDILRDIFDDKEWADLEWAMNVRDKIVEFFNKNEKFLLKFKDSYLPSFRGIMKILIFYV